MLKTTEKHDSKMLEEILEILRKADRVIIVTHQRPDGDALGSATALSHLLDGMETKHDIFCTHKAPSNYAYLPRVNRISQDAELLRHGDHEVLVCLDSGDLAYAGIKQHLEDRSKNPHFIVNIDHHATNTLYGNMNMVDPDASSTAEMVFHLFQQAGHPITSDIATCMLTGIITDTGGFSNLATTSSSLDVASHLIAAGARVWDIQANTQKNKSVTTLKLWGIALSRLKKHSSGVVSTVLTHNDIKEANADAESAEGIANFLNTVEDAKAVIMIREDELGKIKVSMRTTQAGVDVSKLAKFFGGGGHKKASGFSLPGSIQKSETGFRII